MVVEDGVVYTPIPWTQLTPKYMHTEAPRQSRKVGFDEVTAVPHAVQQKGRYGSLEEARILELILHAPTRPQHERLSLGALLPEFPLPTQRSSSPAGAAYISASLPLYKPGITSGRTLALAPSLYVCLSHKSLIPVT